MATKLLVLQIYFACVVLILLPVAAELEARRRLLQTLRDAEALHRLVVERTGDIIMRVNIDGTLRSISDSAVRLWGYQPHEIIGRSVYDLLHPDDEQAVFDARFQALSDPQSNVAVECRLMSKDGLPVWVESHLCDTGQTGRAQWHRFLYPRQFGAPPDDGKSGPRSQYRSFDRAWQSARL
jgi:PAS domain S-box-containing protein